MKRAFLDDKPHHGAALRRVSRSASRWRMACGGLLLCVAACKETRSSVEPHHDAGPVADAALDAEPGLDAEPALDAELAAADTATSAEQGPGSCGSAPFPASPREVSLLLVLDASFSMERSFEGTQLRKWDALKGAVGGALDGVKGPLNVGLQVYPTAQRCGMPSPDDLALTVETAPAAVALPRIRASLDTLSLMQGTPTAAALGRALRYFGEGPGAALAGDRYVLLATDGGPNCSETLRCEAARCVVNMERDACELSACCERNCCDVEGPWLNCLDDVATLQQVQSLRGLGVRTFVVGLPGTEAFAEALDTFAEAGGAAAQGGAHRYFEVSAPEQLSSVLSAITGTLVSSCELQLAQMPPDLNLLNVSLDGVALPQGGNDGWRLDGSMSPPTVVIEGDACERIERGSVRSAEVGYGCPTLVIL